MTGMTDLINITDMLDMTERTGTSNGDWRRKQSNHKMGSVNENWSVSWAVWSVAFISFIDQIEIMMAHAGQIELYMMPYQGIICYVNEVLKSKSVLRQSGNLIVASGHE